VVVVAWSVMTAATAVKEVCAGWLERGQVAWAVGDSDGRCRWRRWTAEGGARGRGRVSAMLSVDWLIRQKTWASGRSSKEATRVDANACQTGTLLVLCECPPGIRWIATVA
jgi:hypothetical protein